MLRSTASFSKPRDLRISRLFFCLFRYGIPALLFRCRAAHRVFMFWLFVVLSDRLHSLLYQSKNSDSAADYGLRVLVEGESFG
jgi:hypothetical protein